MSRSQEEARASRLPLDALEVATHITGIATEQPAPEEETGRIIHGLYLEGGRVDPTTGLLHDALPGAWESLLPGIELRPRPRGQLPSDGLEKPLYRCPTFATAARTQLVTTLDLEPAVDTKPTVFWVLRGVAALLEPAPGPLA